MTETFEQIVERNRRAAAKAPDNRPDGSGLDDGPWLPGQAPRKKAAARPDVSEIRKRAWATRRAKSRDRDDA